MNNHLSIRFLLQLHDNKLNDKVDLSLVIRFINIRYLCLFLKKKYMRLFACLL